MSDTPAPPPTPIDTAPVDPPAVAGGDEDWRVKYEREVEHRKRERNLFAPVARIIEGLHEDDRSTLTELADAIRRQDRDYLVEFGIATAENVSGKSAAELIAARQGQQGMGTPGDITQRAAETQAANPGMTEEQVARAVREALAAEREEQSAEQRKTEYLAHVTNTLTSAGIQPGTDDAVEVIQIARGLGGDVERAIRVWNADRQYRTVGLAAAGAQAASLPAPAPSGAPVGAAPAPNMSPRERVVARLNAKQS